MTISPTSKYRRQHRYVGVQLTKYAIIIVIGLCLVFSTTIAGFNVTFGENEISVEMPKNILTQLIGIGKVKINQSDINQLIELMK